MDRISPKVITQLAPEEVFVFGSNEAGKHLGGAAFQAMNWGAEIGQPYGMCGQTFAIPTLSKDFKQLSIKTISIYVSGFIDFTKAKPELKFLVTEIGCGIAGFTYEQIAPMFKVALEVQNIYLPERFLKQLS